MNKTEAIKNTSTFAVQNLDAVWRNTKYFLLQTDSFFFFFFEGQNIKTYPSGIGMRWSICQQKKALFLLQGRNNSSCIEIVKMERVLPLSCCSHINTQMCFVDNFWKSQ